jgi:hypothetical protein
MHEFLKEIMKMAKENVPDLQMPSPDVDIKALRVKWFNDSEGDLHLSDGYECSVCKNKGFIASISSEGEEVMRNCKCQTIRATLQRAKRSGLGDILKEFTFKKYNAADINDLFTKSRDNLSDAKIPYALPDSRKNLRLKDESGLKVLNSSKENK